MSANHLSVKCSNLDFEPEAKIPDLSTKILWVVFYQDLNMTLTYFS